ncbi:hypothetical protein Sfulv_59440 [Streptomyces fulvorobeus]|uniref:Uncharacterized protein n=1 Tax=Streptomyces fulvorobeus TaxID=284028 RepID=A0A7J0CGU1_9ACTN|nr:hypothetical protein Sfulv_59440 [Streptomyces fulvorobeus]
MGDDDSLWAAGGTGGVLEDRHGVGPDLRFPPHVGVGVAGQFVDGEERQCAQAGAVRPLADVRFRLGDSEDGARLGVVRDADDACGLQGGPGGQGCGDGDHARVEAPGVGRRELLGLREEQQHARTRAEPGRAEEDGDAAGGGVEPGVAAQRLLALVLRVPDEADGLALGVGLGHGGDRGHQVGAGQRIYGRTAHSSGPRLPPGRGLMPAADWYGGLPCLRAAGPAGAPLRTTRVAGGVDCGFRHTCRTAK